MTRRLENFETYRAYNPPIAVEIANNSRIEVLGSGRVRIDLQTGHQAVLSDVLHVPALGSNLLSVSALQKAGKSVVFGGPGICRIMSREGGVIGEAKLVRGLYILQGRTVIPNPRALIAYVNASASDDEGEEPKNIFALTASAVARADLSTWHRRLGHTNLDYILSMERENRVEGMEIIGKRTKPDGRCQPCLRGKQSRTPFPKSSTERNYQPLELIVSDVHGPMAVPTHNGRQYFAPFIDVKTRYLWVAVVTRKSDVREQFKSIRARVELQTGFKIKALRTDGGGEYASNEFETELRQAGIEHQKTEADSSASNGISEKAIRYLNEMERTIRDEAELPPQFWGYAILHSVEIWNVTAKKALGGMTPHEALFGTKPNIARLRVFGCKAFARIPDKDRQKLGARSLECTYLGVAPGRKAHLLVDRKNRRFFTSRDVVFDEGGISRQRVVIEDSEKPEDEAIVSAEPNEPKVEPKVEKTHVPEPIKPEPQVKPEKGDSKRETSESEAENLIMSYAEPEKPAGRPKRNVRAPVRDDDDRYFVSSYEPSTFNRSKLPGTKGKISRPKTTENTPKNLLDNPDDPALAPFHAKLANLLVEPNSYKEAMAREDSEAWLEAMLKEIRMIEAMRTWRLVPRQKDFLVIRGRWVYRIKFDADGNIQTYKARYVAKGFAQRYGIDFNETYAPVVSMDSIHIILAIAAALDLELHQLDVKSAFLNAELDEDVYMEQPEGFVEPGREDWVCKVERGLYGLRQSPLMWYRRLTKAFKSISLIRTKADPCVFMVQEGEDFAFVVVHVDDSLVAANTVRFVDEIKRRMKSCFEMTDLGEAKSFLGIEINRNRSERELKICQSRYIKEILAQFEMTNANAAMTPMEERLELPKLEEPTIDRTLYQCGIGSLMYAMLATRPELAYTVGLLSQHNAAPGPEQWHALKRAIRQRMGLYSCRGCRCLVIA
ncbi:Retrovirus-related Pol polyprotein from transposon TNT 1-94 OS=Nicotiana tabacum PE=2 SV=1 [Rhizoctonia solani AG-1 IB]|uniref:Retrovirus-related Pol polyprotein from transposon TNT 1-94 n=1 Tax=Thanatephorus cucumeris (strain AG1-IB / isolate 7/3/14) TaxID=1108050 RepID=A0A0B7FWN3_THACB|nr:Retrovirus-related Pol polyprotein from transposon TNT 1-94 OS=Nicotiana tabacum PE=2 SV=1 [Rhizoctonia solani AG-1 IB]